MAARGGSASTRVFVGIVIVTALLAVPVSDRVMSSARASTAAAIFVGVVVQAVPFLVLGTVVSGAIAAWITPTMVRRVLPRRTPLAITAASLSGAVMPGCECGSVPIARRLLDRGVPIGPALAFLLSAPAINPVVLVSTAVAFPGEPRMVVARLLGSLATSVAVAGLWTRFADPTWITRRLAEARSSDEEAPRWAVFAESARQDLLHSAAYLTFGALFVAILNVVVPQSVFDTLAGQLMLAIAAMAVLAVVLSVCSEADAFVAASFSTLPALPKLVFMVVGPAIDVKLFAMHAGTFGRAFAVRFAPVVFVVAVLCACLAGVLVVGLPS
ncbi:MULTISPECIES: permease [Nocardiaceae]|uniref:permease n=1 Tax=Nocardiaceae TaxID=85025 RepID=UPI0027DABDB7|nr:MULTISPECIES: permease [Rhodococcus]